MSSEKVQRSHRDLYKTRTPPWKETYRKRCLERLRDSRDKLKARFRNLPTLQNNDNSSSDNVFIQDLMRAELENFRTEQEKAFEEEFDADVLSGEFNIDKMLDMFEDIQKELREEEVRMIEQWSMYEDGLQQEENALCSAIDKLSTAEVICPLCKKHTLLTNKSVIFCVCGLRINTEQDCLTLSNVKQLLEQGLEEHSQQCDREPVYNVMGELGTTNLLMSCPDCDWMSVVI